MPETTRKLKVFLCHASQDKPVVRDLYQRLATEGWIDPWLDEEKLLPGHDWDMEIEKAVEAADVVIVCLSNNSVTKEGYVQRELRFALDVADYKPEETIFIVPIRLDDCSCSRRLRRWHSVDYFPVSLQPATYKKLIEALKVRGESLGKVALVNPATKIVSQKLESWEIEEIKDQQESDLRAWQEEQTSDAAMLRSIAALELKGEEDAETFAIQHARSPTQPAQQVKSDLHPDRWILNGMEFCRIPAGKFLMGTAKSDSDKEKPRHEVNLPYNYWMARFLVTNAQYAQYAKAIGIQHPVDGWQNKKNHPVVRVTWKDAQTYCQWLTDTLKVKLPLNYDLYLPTEAEWEKAACGMSGNRYPWGDTFDSDKCNTSESGKNGTTQVGLYSPQGDSLYGCTDMSGNVLEWTSSLFKPYPYNVMDGREAKEATGNRVVRGGAFDYSAYNARCFCRRDYPFNASYTDLGFRLVVSTFISKFLSFG